MAGIGEAASVIAVIELSAKVASLCFKYSTKVAGAKEEITNLQNELDDFERVARNLKHQLDQPGGLKLSTLPEIKRALGRTNGQLKEVDEKLDNKKSRNPLKRYGRALKWPFESKEVEKIIASLERNKSTINLALQAHQT
jgi:hypothetical protein